MTRAHHFCNLDIIDIFYADGEEAALTYLPLFLGQEVHVRCLVAVAESLPSMRPAWRIMGPLWCAIISQLAPDRLAIEPRPLLLNEPPNELRAYYFNDLGAFLLGAGDPRCIPCFLSALRLTRSAGRRFRTLGRLGQACCLVNREWDRAGQFYRAAIKLGDREGYNPLHGIQARWLLRDLALDRGGLCAEFNARRRGARKLAMKCAGLLRNLKVPRIEG